MKKTGIILTVMSLFFCVAVYMAYSQCPPVTSEQKIDVNKDGKPDVTYYSEGKYVTRAEADTIADSKPDIIVHAKDGKFQSAEADTDNDGKADKNFNDLKSFDEWLTATHPDFDRTLNRGDWEMQSN